MCYALNHDPSNSRRAPRARPREFGRSGEVWAVGTRFLRKGGRASPGETGRPEGRSETQAIFKAMMYKLGQIEAEVKTLRTEGTQLKQLISEERARAQHRLVLVRRNVKKHMHVLYSCTSGRAAQPMATLTWTW